MPKKRAETEIKPEAQETEATSGMSPGNFETTAVVGLPKFHPHVRPVTTEQVSGAEQVSGVPVRQSYEQVQESARGAGVEQWREVDRVRAELGELYRNLKEDAHYSEDFKAETAWQRYEEAKARVEKLAPVAKQKMLKSAESLERLSIPTPEGEGLITKVTNKLLLTAHERSRLEGLINRAEKSARGPFRANPTEILKTAYERGLDQGGPGGGATVRAVYELALDWGLDIETIVDAHRKAHHRGALEDAQTARMRANMVGRTVPEPPFKRGSSSKPGCVGTYSNAPMAFIPRDRPMHTKRAPSWK
jgi:hypothetical protein